MDIKKMILGKKNYCHKINAISTIRRITENYIGAPVDCLYIEFDCMPGIAYAKEYEIKARTIAGVMEEIKNYTREYFAECANNVCYEVDMGHINWMK